MEETPICKREGCQNHVPVSITKTRLYCADPECEKIRTSEAMKKDLLFLQNHRKEKQKMEFKEFPKIARLSREVIVTEKIDGTNGQIFIGDDGKFLVGSRTRWITPENDNHGFARWAFDHIDELMIGLGPGRHFGEWWGSGIQRGYGLPKGEKRFSLFNTLRWGDDRNTEKYPAGRPVCCHVVPVIWRGIFDDLPLETILLRLPITGSHAAPGFMDPEGVVIYHVAGNVAFKKTLGNDGHKGETKWKL